MFKGIKKIFLGRKENNSFGFTLVEVLIAIALLSVIFTILLGVGFSAVKASSYINRQTQTNFLLREEFEAIRNFRDGTTWATDGLGTVNTDGTIYHIVNNLNTWNLALGDEQVGIFTRQVFFNKVSRDPATQNIESVYNASHDDPNTRKTTITLTFAWNEFIPPIKVSQAVFYFTNWQQ